MFLNKLLKHYLESICLNLRHPKILLMKKLLSILLIFSGVHFSAFGYEPITVFAFQEKTIHPKDLPENIRKYVTDNYSGAQITKAAVEESSGVVEGYTVIINFKLQEITLKFDKKGEFVRKE